MTSRRFSQYLLSSAVALIAGVVCPALFAQGPLPEAPVRSAEPPAPLIIGPLSTSREHKFWDNGNRALFAATIAFDGADFAVTRANLQNGGQELNPMVRVFGRSTAGLAANFAGESIGTIALSYMFHRTGHHKMERIVSFVNIGGSAGAVGYGLEHR